MFRSIYHLVDFLVPMLLSALQERRIFKRDRQEAELEPDLFPAGWRGRAQARLWDLFERPQSSVAATAVSLVSIGLVMASLLGFRSNPKLYF